jgi:hypothetical protein
VPESRTFETACSVLEQSGGLDCLVARGTVRLALKQAGLDAKTVTAHELVVVARRLLPGELRARGVADPEGLCGRIEKALESVESDAGASSPEAIFARLGRS